jgi:tetratricopeptide (TPR) repeat protein
VSASFFANYTENDFFLFDRFTKHGRILISTLFQGDVSIAGENGIEEFLSFDSLEGSELILPEGAYIVSIKYRNGYQENRQIEISHNTDTIVSFAYRPSLSAGSFSGRLPPFGVNVAELNPSGYRNVNQNVLSSMGMDQYLISFLAGEKYLKQGNYDKAILEFNNSIRLNPNFTENYIARGNAYQKRNLHLRAIDDYSQALKYCTDRAEIYNYRGFAYLECKEYDNAISDFSSAIKLKSDYVDAFINRGAAYYEKLNYQSAIDDYSQVIKFEPQNAFAWNKRGTINYLLSRNGNAISDFSKAISIKYDYHQALLNRGNVYFNIGDYQNALNDLNQVVKFYPSASAYKSRANIYQKLGEIELAENDLAMIEKI